MLNTYWNNNGKHQAQYNKLIRELRLKNDMNSSLLNTACDLYSEYYQCSNSHLNDEWRKYMTKFDHLYYHIPSARYIINTIVDKARDEEVSEEMEYLYESLMDSVLEYVIANQPKATHIREYFECSIEDCSDLVRDPNYQYKLYISVRKGLKTGLEVMSLDELEKLGNDILTLVAKERDKKTNN